MTEQEQQIALCEWARIKPKSLGSGFYREDGTSTTLPDTNSLDALHEMVKRLETMEFHFRARYEISITEIAMRDSQKHSVGWLMLVLEPKQIREALLKTLGLWKEL